jgi:hypothetical protein
MPTVRPLLAVLGIVLGAAAGVALVAPAAVAAANAAAADPGPAYLRAAHLVPDLPAMDVTLSSFSGPAPEGPSEPVLTITAGYGDVGEYAPLEPGFYAVALRPAGSPADAAPILSATFEALPGQAYTGAGVGTADDARLAFFEDDLAAPGDGSARIRVVNAARQADPVEVVAVDGPVVARDAAYATPTTYATVPAQSWQLRAAGGAVQGTATTELASNAVYSLLVLEGEGGSLTVRPVLDAAGATQTPVGGAATGLGGLAQGGTGSDLVLTGPVGVVGAAGVAAALAAAAVLFVARRRASAGRS